MAEQLFGPVRWAGDQEGKFKRFMYWEITRLLDERQPLEETWQRYIKNYRARQPDGLAEFPFEGASNTRFPYSQMSINPIWANAVQTLHAPKNLWTITPLNEKWLDVAKPLQDYLEFFQKHILNMWDVNSRVLMECFKLGTGIYKTTWLSQANSRIGYDARGLRTKHVVYRNQPVVDHVSLKNFLIPSDATSENPDEQGGAQWVGEVHRMRPAQLKAMADGEDPRFDPKAVAEVLKSVSAAPDLTPSEQVEQEMSRFETGARWPEEAPLRIYEIHARFDTTGDGYEDDIIVYYSKECDQILRATYNNSPNGMRPYDVVRYIRAEGFYGIGVGEQAEWVQKVTDMLMNGMLDKTILSNAPMFEVPEGAPILPNEPIHPGKIWFTPDGKSINPLFLSDQRGSLDYLQNLDFVLRNGNQLVGVDSLRRGSIAELPGRTPASTVQSMLQESNTLFDMTIKDIRMSGLSQVGLKVLQLIQQHAKNRILDDAGQQWIDLGKLILGSPEGEMLERALLIPDEDVTLGVGIELTATSGTNNRTMQQQQYMTLLNLSTQLGPILLQLVQQGEQMEGTASGETAMGIAKGIEQLYLRLLEQFDMRNPEDIGLNVKQATEQFAATPQGPATAAPAGAGNEQSPEALAAQGAGPPAGLEGSEGAF